VIERSHVCRKFAWTNFYIVASVTRHYSIVRVYFNIINSLFVESISAMLLLPVTLQPRCVAVRTRTTTQAVAESTTGQGRRTNIESSKAKPATSTSTADRPRSSTTAKTSSTTAAAAKRTTRKVFRIS